MTGRRRFLAKAGGAIAAVGAVAVVDAPNVIAQPRVQWQHADSEPRRQGHRQRGRNSVLTPGADIYASLERGVIDAAEWIGP